MRELFYDYLIDTPLIHFRLIDLLDIALIFLISWQLYRTFRNSVAFRIVLGLTGIILLWLLVDRLDLKMSSGVLNQFISVGAIALLIVFQQEVRKFLLLLGRKYHPGEQAWLQKVFGNGQSQHLDPVTDLEVLVNAAQKFSEAKVGAIIVIGEMSDIQLRTLRGQELDAALSLPLLETIFSKSSLLHDGAVIVHRGRIVNAACVLPVSENPDLPGVFGLRHRAGLGITENTLATSIIISEETGQISIARQGELRHNVSPDALRQILAEGH